MSGHCTPRVSQGKQSDLEHPSVDQGLLENSLLFTSLFYNLYPLLGPNGWIFQPICHCRKRLENAHYNFVWSSQYSGYRVRQLGSTFSPSVLQVATQMWLLTYTLPINNFSIFKVDSWKNRAVSSSSSSL